MQKFQDRYNVQSMRLHGRDYAAVGSYFVTICAKHRVPWFGEIQHGIMGLHDIGCIVADELQRTTVVRSNVSIPIWVVMPDHVHAMVVIGPHDDHDGFATGGVIARRVETSRRDVSTFVATLIPICRFRANTLGSIVNHIKARCTKRIRAMGNHDFSWQSGYYDRIVRSSASYAKIASYIKHNPRSWDKHDSWVDLYHTKKANSLRKSIA